VRDHNIEPSALRSWLADASLPRHLARRHFARTADPESGKLLPPRRLLLRPEHSRIRKSVR
jgi:hypothetical protein